VGGGVRSDAHPDGFLHRVVDYVAFRVLASPESAPAGLCDLSAGPAELIKRSAVPAPAGT
jgi:hypothetical protein